MTSNYNPQRIKNLFSPDGKNPFKLSRSKIQNFLNCQRCFFLDRRCGTDHPPSFPFTLNNAVDSLLKKEFDQYRTKGTIHPLCQVHGIEAIPFTHPDLDSWRMNLKGIQYLHEPTNFIITGAVDDIWIKPNGELIVVDYKATSTTKEITLDEEYRKAYKNQMDIYQWLLRKKGFKVSNTGYFVYCNGITEKEEFSEKLEFKIHLIPYKGNDSWIEQTLSEIKNCLMQDSIPEASDKCDYCKYYLAVRGHLRT